MDDLISKKELLELTDISYGQLYRWKRKQLIPEEWFIRKSAFTGQETFFPRREILARIEKIKHMKEDLSLDDLATMFSPNPSDIHMSVEEVLERNIVTESTLQLFLDHHTDRQALSFTDMLAMYTADLALQSGTISLAEAPMIFRTMKEHMEKFQNKPCELFFVRNLGVGTCLLVQSPVELYFESGSKLVFQCHIATCVEKLKANLT